MELGVCAFCRRRSSGPWLRWERNASTHREPKTDENGILNRVSLSALPTFVSLRISSATLRRDRNSNFYASRQPVAKRPGIYFAQDQTTGNKTHCNRRKPQPIHRLHRGSVPRIRVGDLLSGEATSPGPKVGEWNCRGRTRTC